ncbi:helix-turn-helix domain-containing protein [Undibacterium curvum]
MKACGVVDQSRFAREAGVSTTTLNRILSGAIKQPSAIVMAKIAKRGGVSFNWLILGDGDESDHNVMRARIISHQESILIDHFRSISARGRELILSAAAARLRDESR